MKLVLLSLTLAMGASKAAAQTVLFEDAFETGLSNWSVSAATQARWHHVRDTNECLGGQVPFPSGQDAARAGRVLHCDFGDGTDTAFTRLTLLQPVDLPAGSSDLRLSFWSYDDVECDSCDWDWRFVYVSADGGASWQFLGESDRVLHWYQVSFDLTPWAGKSVLVRFELDAVDWWANDGLGWLIDDVRIVDGACGPPQNYCVAAPNSAGPGAMMGWTGSTSIAADDFSLTLSGGPPNQFSHFFYGPDQQQVAVGDGWLCVAPGAVGFVRLLPPAKIDGTGALTRKIDYPASYATKGWLTPGSTWNFQGWYRDPTGGPGKSNFTDGLRVTFCP